jgi:hypothetical protein
MCDAAMLEALLEKDVVVGRSLIFNVIELEGFLKEQCRIHLTL